MVGPKKRGCRRLCLLSVSVFAEDELAPCQRDLIIGIKAERMREDLDLHVQNSGGGPRYGQITPFGEPYTH